jgi:hypothetical protein
VRPVPAGAPSSAHVFTRPREDVHAEQTAAAALELCSEIEHLLREHVTWCGVVTVKMAPSAPGQTGLSKWRPRSRRGQRARVHAVGQRDGTWRTLESLGITALTASLSGHRPAPECTDMRKLASGLLHPLLHQGPFLGSRKTDFKMEIGQVEGMWDRFPPSAPVYAR